MATSGLRPGWTLDDWLWRLVACLCLLWLPVMALLVWLLTHHGYWKSLRLVFADICFTLIYGDYDKKENE